ncbi:arylsulfatase [Persicitalea sp.]|uniref:arylsulfatase n=1 Tax=Persicitalea sp. TaxID=3100273 RepID=UPI003593D9C2
MNNRVLACPILIFLALICAAADTIAQSKSPNIIFIMADDLGYGDLGCYGQEKIKTPRIDQIAKEGMRFTDFYAGATVCAPSRCSLLTGKHNGNAYVRGNYEIGHWRSYLGQLPIPAEETTIFEVLKQKNYATACYGKWAMGRAESSGAPDQHGVDDFFGYNCQRHAHSYYPYYLEGNRGEKFWQSGNSRQPGGKTYSHDVLADKALDYIKANKDTAFFLYVPFTIPHGPLEVPDLNIYKNEDWDVKLKTQAAMISRMDKDVGRIMDLLKELGIDDNTIVFFTSDNGAHGDGGTLEFFKASGPLRGRKRDLYEGGIRTPMVVRWPGKVKPGSESNFAGAFWDIMPTLAEITETKVPSEIDGISFLPELLGLPQPKHHYLYWEFYEKDGKQAIRKGKWKAVRLNLHKNFHGSPVELYNLEEDISESNNLASKYPEIANDLLGLMQACHTPSPYFKFKSQ